MKNWSYEIEKLPYIFKDPVKFDKKIDQRYLQFGSRINKESTRDNQYHRVTEIITPEKVMIDNKFRVKLLGIKERKEKKKVPGFGDRGGIGSNLQPFPFSHTNSDPDPCGDARRLRGVTGYPRS